MMKAPAIGTGVEGKFGNLSSAARLAIPMRDIVSKVAVPTACREELLIRDAWLRDDDPERAEAVRSFAARIGLRFWVELPAGELAVARRLSSGR